MTERHALGNGHNGHGMAAGGDDHRSREELEQRANLVLSELLRRIDVLDDRRHQLQNAGAIVKYEVKRHLPLAIAVGAGTIALGVAVARFLHARQEREFRRQLIGRLLSRVLGSDVVQPPRRAPGVLGITLRQTGMRLLLLAGSELGRRALHQALESRQT